MSELRYCSVCDMSDYFPHRCDPLRVEEVEAIRAKYKADILEAERRGEERGWEAALAEERVEPEQPIYEGYSYNKPKWSSLSDWRASEEYKEGK